MFAGDDGVEDDSNASRDSASAPQALFGDDRGLSARSRSSSRRAFAVRAEVHMPEDRAPQVVDAGTCRRGGADDRRCHSVVPASFEHPFEMRTVGHLGGPPVDDEHVRDLEQARFAAARRPPSGTTTTTVVGVTRDSTSTC
jgi:hypothetical protein